MFAMRVTPRFLLLPAVYVEEKYNIRVWKIYFELLKKYNHLLHIPSVSTSLSVQSDCSESSPGRKSHKSPLLVAPSSEDPSPMEACGVGASTGCIDRVVLNRVFGAICLYKVASYQNNNIKVRNKHINASIIMKTLKSTHLHGHTHISK